jgi:hypothetical protein
MSTSDPTLEEVLDELDPGWSERWRGNVQAAAKYYQTWNFEGWMRAVQNVRGGPPIPERNSQGETFEQFYARVTAEQAERGDDD